MKYLVILFLAFVTHIDVNAQQYPHVYEYFPNKTLVFRNDYNDTLEQCDDDISYESDDTLSDYEIINGVFHYVNKGAGYIAYPCKTILDLKRNFEISFCARITGTKKTTGIVFWGRVPGGDLNGHYFYFRRRDNRIFFSKGNPDSKNLMKKQRIYSNNIIKENGENVYVIRKVDDKYYVFVNRVLIGTSKYEPLQGQFIGVGGGPNSIIDFDYISVSYID